MFGFLKRHDNKQSFPVGGSKPSIKDYSAAKAENRSRKQVFYDDTDEDSQEPTHMDYVKSPSGSLGSKVSVGQIDGDFLGEFDDDSEADAAIREHMNRNQIFSTVWFQSDHGNNFVDTDFRA